MRRGNKIDDLLKALMGNVEIEAVEERFPSMQEVFIELTKEKEVEDEK